jgi:hypothetical protein
VELTVITLVMMVLACLLICGAVAAVAAAAADLFAAVNSLVGPDFTPGDVEWGEPPERVADPKGSKSRLNAESSAAPSEVSPDRY